MFTQWLWKTEKYPWWTQPRAILALQWETQSERETKWGAKRTKIDKRSKKPSKNKYFWDVKQWTSLELWKIWAKWQCEVTWGCCMQNELASGITCHIFWLYNKERVCLACEEGVFVLRQGTVEIHRCNGGSMSSCPSSVADRWFCPTGSGAMLLREDSEKGADWQIRTEGRVDKAKVDKSPNK